MTNNERKRKHKPKYTRHWRKIMVFRITKEQLKSAFGNPDSLWDLLTYLYNDIESTLYRGW